MKQILLILTLFTSAVFFSANTFAATSEVTWSDYENYRDIRETSMTRTKFREFVFNTLEEHFSELAATLPADNTLKINVTNVDLAGDINVASMNDIRVIKSMYPPQMTFSYQLIDAEGKTIISADDFVLRDMGFMSSVPLKYRKKTLGYEMNMLDKWFRETFKNYIKEQ